MKSLKTTIVKFLGERDENDLSRQDAIAMAVIEKAMKGDLHAVAFIRDMTDKPKKEEAVSPQTVTVRVLK